MDNNNTDYFDIIASVTESQYEEIPDWTDEAFIVKRTLSYASSNGSKRVVFNYQENVRWSRKTDKD